MNFSKYLESFLAFAKENYKYGVSFLLKQYLKLSGLGLYLASMVIEKLVAWGIIAAENAVGKKQDQKAAEEIKEEIKKPVNEIDQKKLDELEREILEGK